MAVGTGVVGGTGAGLPRGASAVEAASGLFSTMVGAASGLLDTASGLPGAAVETASGPDVRCLPPLGLRNLLPGVISTSYKEVKEAKVGKDELRWHKAGWSSLWLGCFRMLRALRRHCFL